MSKGNRAKKVSLESLKNHNVSNKRQAMKDIKMLNFDELQYKNPAKKRFYKNISKKDTSDIKFKKLRRLTSQPHYLAEDLSP